MEAAGRDAVRSIGHRPAQELARRACFHLSAVAQARVVRQWAGLYDMTEDSHHPWGGAGGLDGFFLDVGWSGHGIQLGPIVGQVLAEILTGREPSIDNSALRPERFAENDLCPEPVCVYGGRGRGGTTREERCTPSKGGGRGGSA